MEVFEAQIRHTDNGSVRIDAAVAWHQYEPYMLGKFRLELERIVTQEGGDGPLYKHRPAVSIMGNHVKVEASPAYLSQLSVNVEHCKEGISKLFELAMGLALAAMHTDSD